jgi:hypothetical protein
LHQRAAPPGLFTIRAQRNTATDDCSAAARSRVVHC